MDPKAARKLLDEVCAELDPSREAETQRALEAMVRRVLRPLGLGLLLSASLVAPQAGCGDGRSVPDTLPQYGDAYGVPPRDAYGIPADWLPPMRDAYGIPRDVRPWDWLPTKEGPPPAGDLYGVIDKKLPPVNDAYGVPDLTDHGVPDKKLPPVGDAYGIPSKG